MNKIPREKTPTAFSAVERRVVLQTPAEQLAMQQAILDINAVPPAEQGDSLVLRRLDDARWSPNIPLAAYKDAKCQIVDGQVLGIQQITRFVFDSLLGSAP